MSFHEAPVEFCPHRTNIEYNVQYTPIGDVKYYGNEFSGDEGLEDDGGDIGDGWFLPQVTHVELTELTRRSRGSEWRFPARADRRVRRRP